VLIVQHAYRLRELLLVSIAARRATSVVLLHGPYALHDVDDVEGFCERILGEQLRILGARLRFHDQEDALAFLLSVAWRLSVRYDPSVGQSFSTYARRQLKLRVVDWLRTKLGRTRWSQSDRGRVERPRRELLSLDGSSTKVVNWSAVSERGRWILRSVAIPLSVGYLPTEVAKMAGVRRRDLDDLLAELAAELSSK
jgi:hypothetical protein